MSKQIELTESIDRYRKRAHFKFDLQTIADAYIAHLDEQETLNQPYDWEWLESLPQFNRLDDEVTRTSYNKMERAVWAVRRNGYWWWSYGKSNDMYPIPTPATKGDVLKLLKVLIGDIYEWTKNIKTTL